MKRITLIATVLAVCIFQSWAQNVTDTLNVSACKNVPYYYQKHNGLIIQCVDGLQIVDTLVIGSDSLIKYVNLIIKEKSDPTNPI